jgi:hypothetical protein
MLLAQSEKCRGLGGRAPAWAVCSLQVGPNRMSWNGYDDLIRATVQNLKRVGTKIFFIGVRTRTYGDFGGWRNPFSRFDSCNTARNREGRIDLGEVGSVKFDVRSKRRPWTYRATTPRCPVSFRQQSQSLDCGLGTALWPAGRSYKTKPIWRWLAGIRGRIMRNKAKLGQDGASEGWRAGEGAIVQNEPNRPTRARVGTGRGTSPARPSLALIAPNKANSPSSETKGKCFGGKELW